jgi:hypothetical protein
MEPKWIDVPQFIPLSRQYYQNLHGYKPLEKKRSKPDQKRTIRTSIYDKSKLQHLIQILAVSEIEKKNLASKVDEIIQQKSKLDQQVQILIREKEQLLETQQGI